jgi:hypothetical protein
VGTKLIRIVPFLKLDGAQPEFSARKPAEVGPDGGVFACWFATDPEQMKALQEGAHRAEAQVSLFDREMLQCASITLTQDWMLWRSDAAVVTLRRDDALATKMRTSVRLYDLQVNSAGTPRVWVDVFSTPMDVAFDVALLRGESEIPLGQIARPAGQPMTTFVLVAPAGGGKTLAQDEQVEILFRSSVTAAVRTVDLTEIWDGRFVVPQVRVARANATHPPSPGRS